MTSKECTKATAKPQGRFVVEITITGPTDALQGIAEPGIDEFDGLGDALLDGLGFPFGVRASCRITEELKPLPTDKEGSFY